MVAARRRSASSGPLRGVQRHVRRRARSCVQSNLPAMPTIGEGGLIPPISGQSPTFYVNGRNSLAKKFPAGLLKPLFSQPTSLRVEAQNGLGERAGSADASYPCCFNGGCG